MSSISSGTTLTTALVQTADTSGVLQLQTNGTTPALTLDTAQNAGYGVTPSGWTGGPATQFKYGGSVWNNNDSSFHISENAYYNGSWNYISGTSAAATNYYQLTGTHNWRYASAGTGALTWTTGMTLDASGQLGVGVAPSYKLDIQTSSSSAVTRIKNTLTTGYGTTISYNDAGAYVSIGMGGSAASLFAGQAFIDSSSGVPIVFAINDSEKSRIDTGGNILLGFTNTPTQNGTSVSNSLVVKNTIITGPQFGPSGPFGIITSTSGTVNYNATLSLNLWYFNGSSNQGAVAGHLYVNIVNASQYQYGNMDVWAVTAKGATIASTFTKIQGTTGTTAGTGYSLTWNSSGQIVLTNQFSGFSYCFVAMSFVGVTGILE